MACPSKVNLTKTVKSSAIRVMGEIHLANLP